MDTLQTATTDRAAALGSSTAPATAAPTIRPLRPEDRRDVRRVFRETVVLGSPVALPADELAAYTSLSIGWYLTNPQHSLVVVEDGVVRGYLLGCLDHGAFEQWQRRAALRWSVWALGRVATLRSRGDSRRFTLLRLHDGLRTLRLAPPPPHPAHGHLNLDANIRGADVGHRLVDAMDRMVAEAGLDGWYGEMNWPRDQSLDAIEAAGAVVVHRQRNLTLSWLGGRPIDRATVARPLARATDSVRGRAVRGGAR